MTIEIKFAIDTNGYLYNIFRILEIGVARSTQTLDAELSLFF